MKTKNKVLSGLLVIPLMVVTILPLTTNADINLGADVGANIQAPLHGPMMRTDGNANINEKAGDNNDHMDERRGMMYGDRASTTWNGQHSSSTWNGEGRDGTSTRMMRIRRGNAMSGTILSIGSSSFTIQSQTQNGTTTDTVNIASTTVFQSGTTTIALSNLTVGQRVFVAGDVSTTTATVEANRVIVIPARMANGDSQTSVHNSFFHRLFNWFKRIF
jgi:hypothetical protein